MIRSSVFAALAISTWIHAEAASSPPDTVAEPRVLLAQPEQSAPAIPVDGPQAVYCEVPLSFTVLADGQVADVEVTGADVKPRYARHSIAHVSKWVYAPGDEATRLRTTITYRLGDVPPAQRRGCVEL